MTYWQTQYLSELKRTTGKEARIDRYENGYMVSYGCLSAIYSRRDIVQMTLELKGRADYQEMR